MSVVDVLSSFQEDGWCYEVVSGCWRSCQLCITAVRIWKHSWSDAVFPGLTYFLPTSVNLLSFIKMWNTVLFVVYHHWCLMQLLVGF